MVERTGPHTSPTPHLDALFDDIRRAPVTILPGIRSVWIGATAVPLPERWSTLDTDGSVGAAVVRDAWLAFWDRPIRLVRNEGDHELVVWHAARLSCGASATRQGARSGLLLTRRNILGQVEVIPTDLPLHRLCNGFIGSNARALMEAGIRQCLAEVLAARGIEVEIPRALVEHLGTRIEAQLDARIDWPNANQEMLCMALGSRRAAWLYEALDPGDRREPAWLVALFGTLDVVDAWPEREFTLMPFVVPIAQQGFEARDPESVSRWLHAQGMSRSAVSRLHRLPFMVAARIASLMLDISPKLLPVLMRTTSRFLSTLATRADASRNEDDLRDAVAWIAFDTWISTPMPTRSMALSVDFRGSDELPWPESARAEYAILRGYRQAGEWQSTHQRGEPEVTIVGEREAPGFGSDVPLRFGGDRAEFDNAAGLAVALRQADPRAMQCFARLMTVRTIEGLHRLPGASRDFGDTADWIRAAAPRPGIAQLQGSWEDLQRRQRRWHETRQIEILAESADEAPAPATWRQPVIVPDCGPWQAVHLVDTRELWLEGRALAHCVYSYRATCEQGIAEIFSIRRAADGHRHGTAEFRFTDGAWRLVQLRGLRNSDLPDDDTPEPDAFRALLAGICVALNEAGTLARQA